MEDLLAQLNSQVEGLDKLRKVVVAHRNAVRKVLSKQKQSKSHQDCSALWTAYVASVEVTAANYLSYQTSLQVSQSIYQQWYACTIV